MSYVPFLEQTLQDAADIALDYFGNVTPTVKPEDNNQVLTEADLAIGKFIVAAIQRAYPTHNIMDEEAGVIDKGSQLTWVVDPIEATSNFAAGLPDYGIMIGLLDGATPIAGGTITPAHNHLCLAEKGKGATRNGESLYVISETHLLNVLVSYGIDGHQENPEVTKRECELLARVVLGVRNVRNSGCDAIDPVRVAAGSYGGCLSNNSKIWDNVAPQIIVEEAGGLWTSFDGSPVDYSDPLTKFDLNFTRCGASPILHQQLQVIIHSS